MVQDIGTRSSNESMSEHVVHVQLVPAHICNIVLERSPLPFCLKLFARGTYVGSLVIDSMSMGLGLSGALGAGLALVCFLHIAYDIRMYLLRNFGYTIHEFNPWFNYRATEYLAEHGFAKFFTWYDYDLWYPLGRSIGTTIYPGMQMTAVAIWEGMQRVPEFSVPTPWYLDWLKQLSLYLSSAGLWKVPVIPETLTFAPMSVNDICCLIPWFGSLASLFTGLMAYETSRSVNAGVMTAGVMAVIPAHLMRSVGGEFDNEAVAMSAICCTFWLWLRAVRTPNSWPYGVFAGLSCIHMAAAWGGYIFVLNMIGVHALLLTAQGRFHFGLHRAYSIFFIVGTCEALQIPVVGWQPLRSLEQIGPLGVFLGFQALAFCDFWRHRGLFRTTEGFVQFSVAVLCLFVVALAGACVVLSCCSGRRGTYHLTQGTKPRRCPLRWRSLSRLREGRSPRPT